MPPAFQEERHQTSPSSFSASGSRRCRASFRLADRTSASVSDEAGAHHCWLCRRRRIRHRRGLMGQWLSERLDQPFVIENRPGAATNIATQVVVNAPADGYTLLLVGVTNAINTTFYPKLNFNFIGDIAPVASITRQPQAMLVNPSFPAKTIPELIDYAKANPGKINMSSPGVGSISHLAGELFKMMAASTWSMCLLAETALHLRPCLADRWRYRSPRLPSAIEFIRTGKLRGLAVTTTMRSEALPDLPAIGEFVPGYEVSAWYGVGAPKGTPAEVIDKAKQGDQCGHWRPQVAGAAC